MCSNRSLVVGSNSRGPIPEDQRQAKSSIVYVYSVEDNKIIVGSEITIWGIKETARRFGIYIADLQACLHSGQPYKNKYLFSRSPLTLEQQAKWEPVSIIIPSVKSKSTEVWVYYAESLEFIEKFGRVIDARNKYNVSKTTMSRCLNHKISYNGLLFSRTQLH